jgi:hypothetical protein
VIFCGIPSVNCYKQSNQMHHKLLQSIAESSRARRMAYDGAASLSYRATTASNCARCQKKGSLSLEKFSTGTEVHSNTAMTASVQKAHQQSIDASHWRQTTELPSCMNI